MNSMTAYGRGEASNGIVNLVVELRSVNHRFRDIALRVPREYGPLEPRIVACLRDAFERGRIECSVRRTGREGPQTVTPNLRLAEAYQVAMQQVARRVQQDPGLIPLDVLVAQPGVLEASDEDLDPGREWDLLEPALLAAMAHLRDMRATEGEALARDLGTHLDAFVQLLGVLKADRTRVTGLLKTRLEERLRRLLEERVDPARLAQEAAILAEKADVSEEIARLASHVDQFRALFHASEGVGRKMDFLLQEMGRETNTVGSKVPDASAARLVVEMKALLEKMREQAANVE
ncbi:MAG: YicC family protein [Deltaproteobacteria bacterium]|nr:YicC family protein [Deltaproteobacteria bacterium]